MCGGTTIQQREEKRMQSPTETPKPEVEPSIHAKIEGN